jgi:diadenosine tetraphosphatase ApaH/serine/threonine PP2A family protein phosphatase
VKLRKGTRYLINPGSIGQPRDGDNRASFGILDAARMTMTIYRVAYAYEKTQAKIRAAGLPGPLADRLALGR